MQRKTNITGIYTPDVQSSMNKWHALVEKEPEYSIDFNGTSSALFSACKHYRPVLERRISDHDRPIMWIGMNPSTADAYRNDPTVKRELDFSTRWGYGRYIKVNVCDYRSTLPKGMLEAENGARSPLNLPLIKAICEAEKPTIVLCHGVLPKALQWMATETVKDLVEAGHTLMCLGTTKAGMPKHPLYLRADTKLQSYRG